MAIPPKEQMTGNNTTEAQFKSGMNNIVDYLGDVDKQSLTFGTTAELKLIKPKIGQKAKTLDNGKVWEWDGSKWGDTGEGELDRAQSLQNLLIDTNIVIDFKKNTLTGGGGLVGYGSMYLNDIPQNQSIELEPESEKFPLGFRKVCISKTTKLFKVFNAIEQVTADYLILGYLNKRHWHSISSGKQPTIIADALKSYEGYISRLQYSASGEIVMGGPIKINLEEKSVSTVGFHIESKDYRTYIEAQTLTYSDDLTAIVVDSSSGIFKLLSGTDVFSPADILIAKLTDKHVFTSSISQVFESEGNIKVKVLGKLSDTDLTSEPAFLSEELSVTINFKDGVLETTSGYLFYKGAFSAVNASKDNAFNKKNPSFVRYLSYSDKSGFTFDQNMVRNFKTNEALLGYVYNYKFYGFGDCKDKVTIIDASGDVVDQHEKVEVFNSLEQRALLPNKLFFIEDLALPIYKDSMFSNPKNSLEKVRTWIDTNHAETIKRYVPVLQQTILSPSDLSNSLQFVYMHNDAADKRFWKNVECKVAAQSKLKRSLNMLCFGDSLTQDAMPWTFKNKLDDLGATVTSIGTFASNESPNELTSEGRGWWNYRSFIGKDNVSGGTIHTRSDGGKTRTAKFENPFLKLATAQDKLDHPSACFRFTGSGKELSYSEDTDKSGDFYIFDFKWYQERHSVADPDFITIALSTNDIQLDRDIYSRDEVFQYMKLGLEIMIKQISKVLPNVPIGIIPAPAWSATDWAYKVFADDTASWIEVCIKEVERLRLTHANLEVIPVYLHMCRDLGYPVTAGHKLTSDSDVNVSTVSDRVHYDQAGRDQYAEAVCAWLANAI